MIVFPMAGRGTRFINQGIQIPKYFLQLHNHTVFYWVMKSFKAFRDEFHLFILGPHNHSDLAKIAKELQELDITSYEIVVLSDNTDGQATTVLEGLKKSKIAIKAKEDPILIFNIDTIRPNFQCLDYGLSNCWVETFEGQGDHWSFVMPSEVNKKTAIKIVEKKRISNLCCTGAYYFPQVSTYFWLYNEYENIERESDQGIILSEKFVSSILQTAIENNVEVTYDTVDSNYVLASGTPEEYEKLKDIQFPILFK